MQTINLKFTKLEVPEFDRKGHIHIRFHYSVDGKEEYLEKPYGYIKEDTTTFSKDLIAEVKNNCRKKVKPDYRAEGILANYVNVKLEEPRTEEKLSNALKQLRDRIRTIKGMATSNNYINKYVEIKGLIMEL